MNKIANTILQALKDDGELSLQAIAKMLPKKFGDHRDFYPLSALLSQGLIEDSYAPLTNNDEAVRKLASKNQLLAWKFFACSTADKTAKYKEYQWSTHGNDQSLKEQLFALTGAGFLYLEEARIRRNERLFTISLAVFTAILASILTKYIG